MRQKQRILLRLLRQRLRNIQTVVMVHRCLNRLAPQYLAVHCVPQPSHRHFHSTDRNLMHVTRHQLDMYGCFAIASLSSWNSLPDPVCNLNYPNETAFRHLLETRYQHSICITEVH